MSIRDEIRELCIAHDRFMAEQASEPIRSPTVSENDDDRPVIYKRYDPPPAPVPEPEREPSDGEPSFEDAVDKFSEAVARRLDDDDRRIAELERANAELRGKLDAVLELIKPKVWKP